VITNGNYKDILKTIKEYLVESDKLDPKSQALAHLQETDTGFYGSIVNTEGQVLEGVHVTHADLIIWIKEQLDDISNRLRVHTWGGL